MSIGWTEVFTIVLALVIYSLIEHKVIAPRMKYSPPNVIPGTPAAPNTVEEWVNAHFPNAMTI